MEPDRKQLQRIVQRAIPEAKSGQCCETEGEEYAN
jgi:hypothetical protein